MDLNIKMFKFYRLGDFQKLKYIDINMRYWGWTKREKLWFNSNVLMCQFDKGPIVLASIFSAWHKQARVIWEGESQLRKCLHTITLQDSLWESSWFSWLMWVDPAHCGQCNPGTGSPGLYKKAGWTRQEEQTSKRHPSMAYPASRFLPWVSVLTSLHDVS